MELEAIGNNDIMFGFSKNRLGTIIIKTSNNFTIDWGGKKADALSVLLCKE